MYFKIIMKWTFCFPNKLVVFVGIYSYKIGVGDLKWTIYKETLKITTELYYYYLLLKIKICWLTYYEVFSALLCSMNQICQV